MKIRKAEEKDIPEIGVLLLQVAKVHADARPDLFRAGARKYGDDELREILGDARRPVFVAEEDGAVKGYAFCVIQEHRGDRLFNDMKTLYIDDICVDERERGGGVGRALYEFAENYAREQGCFNVTLNVWSCNPAAERFYKARGLSPQKTGMEKIL